MTRFLPGIVAASATLALLAYAGVSIWASLSFFAVVIWTILLPGLAIHRTLRGSSASLAVELAYGFGYGLIAQILVWLPITALGLTWIWWVYPAIILAVSARWWWSYQPYPSRLETLDAWLITIAYLFVATVTYRTVWRTSALPPTANTWYQDLYYFLGNAAELGRTITPMTPQASVYELHYHWFSSVYMSVTSQLSGVDLPTVVTRLWLIPILLTVFGLLLALSWRCAHLWRPGVIAIALSAVSAQLSPTNWAVIPDFSALVVLSPSQIYGLIATSLIIDVLIDIVRNRHLPWPEWLALALAIVGASGAKSSILPTVFCAMGFATLFNWRRWPSWAAMGLLTGGVFLTFWLAGESVGTTRIKPFVTIGRAGPWNDLSDVDITSGLVGWFANPVGLLVLLIVAVTFLIQYSIFLPGLFIKDPASKLFIGLGIAGFSAMMLLSHVGLSQVYFWRGILPLLFLWVGWGVATRWSTRSWWAVFAGTVLAIPWTFIRFKESLPELFLATAGFLIIVVWTSWRRTLQQIVTGLLSAALVFGAVPLIRSAVSSTIPGDEPRTVTVDETAAARALKDLSDPLAMVATNVHCLDKVTTPNCDSRAFWVSALSERRVLIEGWAYTDPAQARAGAGGRPSIYQPFENTTLFDANEAVFYRPNPADIATLKAHGVRWLYADRLAGPVAPQLAEFAKPRGTFGPVTIYELD